MTHPVCPFTRLLEPSRDGLLSSGENDSLEKHLSVGCGSCAAEACYLDWLSAELRRAAPAIDEVALQRRRMPLLVRAEQQRQRWYTQGQQRLGALKGALTAVAVIALGVLLLDRSPRVKVERVSGRGEIRRFTEGEHSVVELGDGRYELQVSRGILDRSLLVRVPDGEIEDLGTSFGVTVQAGHTSRVVVSEGAVELRLQDLPRVTLEAGGVWELRHESEIAPSTIAASAATEPPSPHAPEAKHPAAARSKHVKTSASKTEDAMYLRILDLLRAERKDAARSLAQRYLAEFPDGFRRAEVMRIANPSAQEN